MAKKTKSNRGSGQRSGVVDLAELERLLAFMHKHRLEQLEYERDGIHVMLKRASAPPAGALRSSPIHEPAGEAAESAGAPLARSEPAVTATSLTAAPEDLHFIKSPIVGTFYAAASPGADPFAGVGTQVEPGQVLCIIEAMKLMNEIEADVAGEVTKVFVENEQPVEYGQPLFAIRLGRKK